MKKQFYKLALWAIALFGFAATSYAQFNNAEKLILPKAAVNHTSKDYSKEQKSAWIGGGFDYYDYNYANKGDHIFINASAFSGYEPGDQLTKVKIYHSTDTVNFNDGSSVTYTNTKYTVKIYENPVLGGDSASVYLFDTAIGTPVYQESLTLGASKGVVFTWDLETPYTINSNDFWVALSYDNGIGAVVFDGYDNANEYEYYRYYKNENDGKTYIENTPFILGLSIFTDNGVYQTDLEAAFVNNFTSYVLITETSISATANLSIYPVIANHGPCDAENIVEVSVMAESNEILNRNISYPDQAYLTPGFVSPVYANTNRAIVSLTAAQMNSMGLTGTFDITFTARYQGVDTDTSNNTATLTVTRGDVGIAEHGQNIAVSLYPNPANDILNIKTTSAIENLTICDIFGRTIKQWDNIGQSVEIDDLANGIYLVKIQTMEGNTTRKIIKQ
jgi:hypothetical protein